jgi:hypothetical protein
MSIPASVKQPISETSEDEDKYKYWIGRMEGDHDICDDMAGWSNCRYSSLTEADVNLVVQSCAGDISDERGQENQRDDNVRDVVVFLKLYTRSVFDADPFLLRYLLLT